MAKANSLGFKNAWIWILASLCATLHCALAVDQVVPDASPSGKALPPLASRPAPASEAEIRFQQGLRLSAANQTDAAIRIFSGLTTDYPLLPQPYEQLAALYVKQGKLSRAVDSLRAALDHKLDDGVLQENLGDLYLELARQSYRNALDADNPGPGAADKYAAMQKLGSRAMSKSATQP
jgi:tetratricopeptide (TPR) repeat protein